MVVAFTGKIKFGTAIACIWVSTNEFNLLLCIHKSGDS